jgi:large subunit ribosomal protein L10
MSKENKNLRPEKKAMFKEVQEEVSGALYLLLTDCTGMTVADTLDLKKELGAADAKIKVVKNRMLNLICEDLDRVTGPTSVISGSGDVVQVAKIVSKYAKETDKLSLKGGVVEGAVLSAGDVVSLSKLPGKKEMQAKLVGTLAAPMTQLVGVMDQKVCSLLYVLNAVRDKKEQAA